MMLEVIWLVAFNTTIKLIMRSYISKVLLKNLCFFAFWTAHASHAYKAQHSEPLWVYEHTRSLDKLHWIKLAKVTHLHTLLVLNVLKMLEATSFEKIYTVKKWTRMQNKQCNGVKVSLKVIKFYNNELQTCRLRRLRVTSSLSWWNFCSNLMSICKKFPRTPNFQNNWQTTPNFQNMTDNSVFPFSSQLKRLPDFKKKVLSSWLNVALRQFHRQLHPSKFWSSKTWLTETFVQVAFKSV